MKNRILALLAVCLMALPLAAQSYTAQSGVTFFVQQAATATATSGAVRLPTFSGSGTLTVVETGITGSPSGCTVKLYYQSNGGGANTSVVSTTSFTPSTGVQTFTISPSVASGDNYVAVYACSSTYPTAGLLTASFSPIVTTTAGGGTQTVSQSVAAGTDPCQNPAVLKSSAAISIASASTVQIVALSGTKSIYVCALSDGSSGTTPSFELLPGTGTNCGTPGTALTGVITFTSGSGIHLDAGGGSVVVAPAGDELCAVTVGAAHGGVVTFVQQ